jgi:hypothetical protein
MDKLEQLANTEFEFVLGDKTYLLRKANIDKGILFRKKAKELSASEDDGANDLRMVSFAIYIALLDQEPTLTEATVTSLIPADIDVLGILTRLGFMKPLTGQPFRKTEPLNQPSTTDSSSQ